MARTPKATSTGLVLAGTPRVNLLPPRIIEHRLQVRLTKRWLIGLIVSLLAAGMVGGGAYVMRASAQASLLAEQDRTIQLTAELAGYADVTKALSDRAALTSYRAEAMGNDLEWQAFYETVKRQLPAGVALSSIELTSGANPVTEAERPNTVGMAVRLTLSSSNPIDQDKVVDGLRKLDIAIDANASTLEADSGNDKGYSMVVTFVADQTIYSGRFTDGAGE